MVPCPISLVLYTLETPAELLVTLFFFFPSLSFSLGYDDRPSQMSHHSTHLTHLSGDDEKKKEAKKAQIG